MQRKQAQALIGQQVQVWTAANGIYAGTLLAIHGSPWRGQSRITGIIEPAQHFERGAVCRRGFRVGELIEAGNGNIRATQQAGVCDYIEALQAHQAKLLGTAHANPRHAGLFTDWAAALGIVMDAERRRLAGQPWKLQPVSAAHAA